MNERVVHIMNVARMTPNVNGRTGETFKTARVLKDVYNGINENKMSVRFLKKKKKESECFMPSVLNVDILKEDFNLVDPFRELK